MRRVICASTALLLVVGTAARANKAEYDAAMLELAISSGCMACQSVLPAPRRADGLPPIAPAWRDIALKYRDDPAASERLTRTVMTGSDRQARHWAGKVGEFAMPANAGTVTEAEARVLVNWLLILAP